MSSYLNEDGRRIRDDFRKALENRILVLDGAMGTAIQDLDLDAEAFGGEELAGCNENLVLTRPEAILGIHRRYLEAGSDAIETNTFGGTPLVLGEYDLTDQAEKINVRAAELARQAVDEVATPEWPRFVLGSMGPTTKTLTVTGGVTFEELQESYRVQARGLLRGGADLLVLETVQDTLNLKSGYLGIRQAFADCGITRPIALSCTIEPMGTMLAGQTIDAFYASVEHIDPIFIGMNCATGPRFMTDHLRTLSSISAFPVSCYPNAGLPNEEGEYEETPESLSKDLALFMDQGWLNVVGGCCGTTAEHIRAIVEISRSRASRKTIPPTRSVVTGIEALVLEEDAFPIIVGERTNVIGSRRFKNLIKKGEFERGAEIGRAQVRGGAHIIDVCMADPDREEVDDMVRFLNIVTRMVKVPIMLDSTDAAVIERSLTLCQGKCLINSINLEDGEERFETVVPLARRFGAALVVGCIDEDPQQGMAVTRQRKLEIAQRSHDLLTRKYGVPEEDIIFDPLVFPIGTGDVNYETAGEETIEGVRLIRKTFPRCRTILGISNVSFGLPPAGREVLNSVFLYHCVQAGLASAIVNSEKLERYAAIPEEERALCDDLIFRRTADPVTTFTAFYREKKGKKTEGSPLTSLPLEERLGRNIIDGTKEGLEEALELALAKYETPLEIINGPLMAGMEEVGRLFNDNELIVAEVLQSAEAMKAAVAYLEPHMEKLDSASRGRIVLATVKGDVHDIGKNLVQIILANNGYDVIDLGIKVAPATLIEAAMEHNPDAIGLSGLLVKSAQQMVVTTEDLNAAGIHVPILVGGAALSERFTASKIAPTIDSVVVYAKDAMNGLDIVNQLRDQTRAGDFVEEVRRKQERISRGGSARSSKSVAVYEVPERSPAVEILAEAPEVPDTHLHIEVGIDLNEIFSFVNPQMLYARHLGLKGNFDEKRSKGDPKALELERLIRDLLAECREKKILHAQAIWQFFPVSTLKGAVVFHDPHTGQPLETIPFPRKQQPPFYCLVDYVKSADNGQPPQDHIALMVTTCGQGVREISQQWMREGDYLRSHALQALALEMAEALAEWVHVKIRALWGFPDPAGSTRQDLFKNRYRGRRYSFGYPACPDLSQQVKLWRLLRPDDHLGVELTDGYMMDPEATVSALVFHHPAATYFGVGEA